MTAIVRSRARATVADVPADTTVDLGYGISIRLETRRCTLQLLDRISVDQGVHFSIYFTQR